MGVTPPEIKTLLKEHNLWVAYWQERADNKKDGATPAELEQLLQSYIDQCELPENKSKKITLAPEIIKNAKGKKATAAEIVRWVLESLLYQHEDVNLMKAPDIVALKYYIDCRESPAFYTDFKKNYANKHIGQGDKEDENNFDGKDICDLIDVLVEMNKVAKMEEKKILREIDDGV